MLKTEENLRKHQMCMAEDDRQVADPVKRRRRHSLGFHEQKTEQYLQVDQGVAVSSIGAKRSSRFRGVSRHKWTGRYEAHLWDKLSWNVTRKKKGKQVYLGAYDNEGSAATAYDLAALKYWGTSTVTNFPISYYDREIELMQNLTKEEYLATLRRKSSGFSRGVSKYRGVARHHQNGRWEARIGRALGNKYLYLGTYSTQEEAARAYDIAAIECRGIKAVTNFDLSSYIRRLKPGPESLIPHQEETESQTNIFTSNFTLREEPKSSILQNKKGYGLKQEESQESICVGSFKRSSYSPALSTLLRSSIFKELVEKNSSGSDDEIEIDVDGDTNNLFTVVSDNEDGDIFYGGLDSNPFLFSSDGDDSQLQENYSSLYYRSGLSLWETVTSLPLNS